MRKKNGDESICWYCERATGGCSWSKSFKPVKGWTAKQTVRQGWVGTFKSYCVKSCPLFVDDRPTEKPRVLGDYYECPRCTCRVSRGATMCRNCKSAYLDWTDVPGLEPPRKLERLRTGRDHVAYELNRHVVDELLESQGFSTLREFAAVAGMPASTIYYALGKSNTCKGVVTSRVAQRIADGLGVTVEEIAKRRVKG